MLVSLHMIAHCMQDFEPCLEGEPSGRIFDRIHMRTDSESVASACAVAEVEPGNGGPESNTVTLRAGEGTLVFSNVSAPDVLNALQDTLAYYRDIEARLATAPMEEHPEQAALSAVEELIGPSFIYSNDFRLLAVSRNYDDVPVNAFWNKYVLGRRVDNYSLFDGWSFMGMTLERHSMEAFVEPTAAPYQYGIFNSYLNSSGEIIGCVVVSSLSDITPFDHDITSVLMEALADIQARGSAQSEYGPPWFSDDALAERLLLHGGENDPLALDKRYGTAGKSFVVLAAQIFDEHLRAAFRLEASTLIGTCISLSQADSLLFLVWGDRDIESRLIDRIAIYVGRVNSRIGISNRFESAAEAYLFAPQALFALKNKGEGLVHTFFGSALSFMIHCQDENLLQAARHPAARQLERLSRSRNADLSATLREYLMCDRSIKRAAERLFLHRNTIIYRIEQAKSLCDFDLDNDYERHYLLYSLLA